MKNINRRDNNYFFRKWLKHCNKFIKYRYCIFKENKKNSLKEEAIMSLKESKEKENLLKDKERDLNMLVFFYLNDFKSIINL